MKLFTALALIACLFACSNKEAPRATTPSAPAPPVRDAFVRPDADAGARTVPAPARLDPATLALASDAILGGVGDVPAPTAWARADREEVCARVSAGLEGSSDGEQRDRVVGQTAGRPWLCADVVMGVLAAPEAHALDNVLLSLTTLRRASHRDDLSRAPTPAEEEALTARVIALLGHENKVIRRTAGAALTFRDGGEAALVAAIVAEEDLYARQTMEATLAKKRAAR